MVPCMSYAMQLDAPCAIWGIMHCGTHALVGSRVSRHRHVSSTDPHSGGPRAMDLTAKTRPAHNLTHLPIQAHDCIIKSRS
jgi:hypothetical protein